jgi:hypothetical protein
VQAGLGVNFAIPDWEEDILHVDEKVTLGTFLGGGLEVFPEGSGDFSIFLESRWHYSFGDFSFRPDSTSIFKGSVKMGDISLLIGVNFYFR